MFFKLLSNANHAISYSSLLAFHTSDTDLRDEKAVKTQQFKYELKKKYGNLYDLSLVEYVNTRTPITLICKQHGKFEQHYLAHHHDGGCKKCKQEEREQALIAQFKSIHGNRYDYSNSVFNGTKLSAHCKTHGDFWVTISSHAKSTGAGCKKCRIAAQERKLINQFRNVHGYRYDYSDLQFYKNAVKVNIRCLEHGVFKQLASAHKDGQGCPKCVGRLSVVDLKAMFNKVHKGRYIYTEIPNSQRRSLITINCPEHGDFRMSIGAHLDGKICGKCKNN